MSDRPLPTETPPEPAAEQGDRFAALYPSEEGIRAQVARRQRVATGWRVAFLAATSLAVVILSTLLLSIINQSFGLVAEQTDIPEAQLVADHYKSQVLGATNVLLATEDDADIAAGIAADANGIGLLGYAVYADNGAALQALSVDGVAPTAETVAAGTYPLTRPLLLYSSAAILSDKPQVAAFLLYTLQHAEEVMSELGAFPADATALAEQAAALATTLGLDPAAPIDPAAYEGDIVISGSSTLNPVTREIARRFRGEGFQGAIKISSVGTVAGFEAFCAECARVGVDGMIIPDLPMADYINQYKAIAERYVLEFIFLITPETSEARIREIDGHTNGFIYMVSSAATTGTQTSFDSKVEYFNRINSMNLRNPRLIGFGISNKATLDTVNQYSSGAIIGSAFIKALNETQDVEKGVEMLLKRLGE